METEPQIIYHLTPAEYYRSLPADQPYCPREFDRDGFIHCTKGEERLLLVADTVYRRVPGDFVLLMIDERKITPPVKYENVGGIMFPHIYGLLNRDAIVRVVAVGRRADGTFLPFGQPNKAAERTAEREVERARMQVNQLLSESTELRARTMERLAQIERAIAALKTSAIAEPAQPAQTAMPTSPAEPAPAIESTVPVPAPTLETRVAQLEMQVSDLKSQISKLEAQTARIEAQRKSKSRKPSVRHK